MKKRTLMLVLALVAALAMATTGTLAYLSDTDKDVNVMTLGSVDIVQNEQQRVEGGKLDAFVNNQPAYPAVGPIEWADETIIFGGSEFKVFTDELKNVVDKFVTVTNTGKSDAFVRTIVLIEAPDYDPNDLIHVNVNNTNGVSNTAWTPVDIDGVQYVYSVFTYEEALAPNETSLPSLMQLFLDKKATNEDVAKFGDTWEVLVLSQAVQAQGFDNAADALDEAFGQATAANVPGWFADADVETTGPDNNPPLISDEWDGTASTAWYNDNDNHTEIILETAEDLAGLAKLVNDGNDFDGKTVKLGDNVDLKDIEWTPIGSSAAPFKGNFDGQGYTISNLAIHDDDGIEKALFGCVVGGDVTGVNVKNVDISAYSESAAIVGYAQGCTVSDCHVSGDISIVTEWAYVGGIAAHGYMNIEDCSVVASGTGVIKSETRNAVGGILGWLWEDGFHITGCEVANLELTGWANVGGVTGFIHRGNLLDSCSVSDVALTKTRVGGAPSIGLAAGGYSYDASKPITVSNNTFSNVTLSGESTEFASYNILHGSEYDGTDSANFVLTNNTQSGITDNTTVYVP